ncbi:hypothetical protein M8C21_004616 [Ambrosia artemisiifolia]|uniref:NAC domain-containing protein n=1 Tax=Ambrosia artemisiifolia TaxID=4212 RepID=A0AAD5BKN5_AMBAR|nr:hypothetical protein M8C21_004616 [Ambrosia artemisiifolia]
MENRILLLLPGFRFQPTDEELVVHYLWPKVQSIPLPYPIPEADVSSSDPWSLLGASHEERYFLSPVETKHLNGKRTNRTAPSGHWKPRGVDKQVVDYENNHVATKKTFVFYRSKPGNVSKTDWFMHEYKLATPVQGVQNWVICRVFLKKKARKDDVDNGEVVEEVVNKGSIFYVSRDFDMNLDGGSSSASSGSSVVTDADDDEDEDEINSKDC